MAEIIVTLVAKAEESVVGRCVRGVEYVFQYKENLKALKEQVEELKRLQERVIHEVKAGTRDGKVIEDEVERWLNRVDELLQEADQLFKDPRNATTMGCFPSLPSRYRLSKMAMILALYVDQLSSLRFDHVTKTDSEELESRKLMKEKIVSALMDPDVTKIGIYGLAGVGKTLLAQRVAQQVEGCNFNPVCWATASQSLDVERIMKEEGSILIILDDDVKGIIDLQNLLIPLEKRCKFLLISRNQHVLQKNGTQRNTQTNEIHKRPIHQM